MFYAVLWGDNTLKSNFLSLEWKLCSLHSIILWYNENRMICNTRVLLQFFVTAEGGLSERVHSVIPGSVSLIHSKKSIHPWNKVACCVWLCATQFDSIYSILFENKLNQNDLTTSKNWKCKTSFLYSLYKLPLILSVGCTSSLKCTDFHDTECQYSPAHNRHVCYSCF